jgi:signal transduction histidine kinase
VDIRDSGPGIPSIHVGKIFEEHSSYAGGPDRSGGGLGLAICRMILQQHGGRVWAESHPAGAVFSLVLPILPTVPSRDTLVRGGLENLAEACPAAVEEGWS